MFDSAMSKTLSHTRIAAALVLMLAASGVAYGQNATTVGDLSTIQSQTFMLKARVAKATAQSQLVEKNALIGPDAGRASDGRPEVVGVFGSHHLYVTLSYPSGLRVNASEGDIVPGGLRVVSVTADGARLAPVGRHRRVVASEKVAQAGN